MTKTQSIIKGTFILTLTGFITRIIGFFYRMFLSRTFGEESVGLYQLIFPIYALCFSLTAAGFQTAISRSVAHKVSSGKPKEARQFVLAGLTFSLLLSLLAMLLLQKYAPAIATRILNDVRSEPLLIAISYSLPFACVHSCICGYYLGLRQTRIPAISQFIEQVIRVSAVVFIWLFALQKNVKITIEIAVIGVVLGEIFSALYCLRSFSSAHIKSRLSNVWHLCRCHGRELFSLALPLTANRVLLNLLQSVEAISIPLRLQQHGHPPSDALKIYGVLTGMALPCILFPSAITNSVSTMLLPTIADLQAGKNENNLRLVIKKVSGSCFALGFICCIAFLLFGNWMGSSLFHSDTAGDFILILAWICPFLYTNSTFISIINGLGKPNITFFINTCGLLIRIFGVLFLIPAIGIQGYLWGLLASQLVVSALCIVCLYILIKKETHIQK